MSDSNPSAFPGSQSSGMSFRDWFAGKAMAAMITAGSEFTPALVAAKAYEYADAMLSLRKDLPKL